jgi:anti-anti-sigma factor
MSNQATPALFAEITRVPPASIQVKLIGPNLGEREVGIITDMVRREIDRPATALKNLVLDFTNISFMNSMALGMCIDFRNRTAKAGGKTVLTGLNQQLLDLLKMVKVEKLYTIVRSENDLKTLLAG